MPRKTFRRNDDGITSDNSAFNHLGYLMNEELFIFNILGWNHHLQLGHFVPIKMQFTDSPAPWLCGCRSHLSAFNRPLCPTAVLLHAHFRYVCYTKIEIPSGYVKSGQL